MSYFMPAAILRGAGYTVALFFCVTGALHFYWALGGNKLMSGAIPCDQGRRVLNPSKWSAALIGMGLIGCSWLVLVSLHVLPTFAPVAVAQAGLALLAMVMLLRGIGDFRYFGAFKRRGDGPFRSLDTMFFTPICFFVSAVLWAMFAAGISR